jgi:hypothetical protein
MQLHSSELALVRNQQISTMRLDRINDRQKSPRMALKMLGFVSSRLVLGGYSERRIGSTQTHQNLTSET